MSWPVRDTGAAGPGLTAGARAVRPRLASVFDARLIDRDDSSSRIDRVVCSG